MGKPIAELRDLAIFETLRLLPTEACSNLGAALGRTMGRKGSPRDDARARALLTALYPSAARDETEAKLARLWENVGRTFAEFAVLPRMLPENRATLSDPVFLDAVYADDRPLIGCYMHLGNWELLGGHLLAHPRIDAARPMITVMMPRGNRAHGLIAARVRRALPAQVVKMSRTVWRTVLETLRQPRSIACIAVDEIADRRVYAPHFGRRLRTNGNLGKIVRLAAQTGARIMPCYSERLPGVRFISHTLPLIEVGTARLVDEALAAKVAVLDAIYAPIVRKLIDQWYMAIEFNMEANDPLSP